MGSEGPIPVKVHITGFKKFQGVPDNPTETIVSNLKGFLKRRGSPLPRGITVETCTVLDAAGIGSLPMLYEIMESSISSSDPFAADSSLTDEQVIWVCSNDLPSVHQHVMQAKTRQCYGFLFLQATRRPRNLESFNSKRLDMSWVKRKRFFDWRYGLHFGANGGAQQFAIERQAVNEATFRCPDEFGWQPQQVPIVPEDGGTTQTRQTSCSTETIVKHLKKKEFDVVISDDADRFVCNYIYYHSLRFAEQKGHKSLFVHVPLFSRIDEDTQMEFAASLLEALTTLNY